ncbi:hypothetical protein [Amycolatopsis sp. NPDC051372]|uniref:hypothetical protein n=1 Tax=unclassified Amycolatopsis TaxID=2618356 RepID=UPI00342C17B2
MQKARDAALGQGQVVLLRGPAGIGKTKLVAAALDELDTVAATVLTVTCVARRNGRVDVAGLATQFDITRETVQPPVRRPGAAPPAASRRARRRPRPAVRWW